MAEAIPRPRNMDLKPLYCFLQVATHGSFSRAAAATAIEQPLVSRLVKRLEDELQVQLFHRHGRGVTLTEAGAVLQAEGRAILRRLVEVETDVASMSGLAIGPVCIAMPPLFGGVLALDLVERLRAEHPGITIHLREGYATDVLDWLSDGSIDIGVLFNAPNIPTLVVDEIGEDRIALVGAPGSFAALPAGKVPARLLAGLPMIVPPRPHRLRGLFDQLGEASGVALTVAAEVSGISTILDLVRAGVGHTVVPSMLARGETREGRLEARPLIEPEIRPMLCVATSRRKASTGAVKVALALVTALLAAERRGARPSPRAGADPA